MSKKELKDRSDRLWLTIHVTALRLAREKKLGDAAQAHLGSKSGVGFYLAPLKLLFTIK